MPKRTTGAILLTEDGKVVLQRRTADDPHKPNKLALFGGHMEDNESPQACIARELEEETSLRNLAFKELAEQHWYTAAIESDNFAVYEGVGAESFTLEEALARDDLSFSTRYALERLKYDRKL